MRLVAPPPAEQKANREERALALKNTRERRARTRQLILLGSWVAAHPEDKAARHVIEAMAGWLVRDVDRRAFGLPAKHK